MPIAIGERGIDKIYTQFERAFERPKRLVISSALPLFTADAPCSKTNFADFRFGGAQLSIVHSPLFLTRAFLQDGRKDKTALHKAFGQRQATSLCFFIGKRKRCLHFVDDVAQCVATV